MDIRKFILNINEPVVIKNQLDWNLLNWDLAKWQQVIGEQNLIFRSGSNQFTQEPQWERTTKSVEKTFEEFRTLSSKECDEWLYFDYKYLKEWLNIEELRNNINWSKFGFPELAADQATIWIGSKGAHTPCHIDTYGCNLIAQIYGRKQWIVFPPEENLKPTRIPYEESSIYSQLNFFSPTLEHFQGIGNCRKITLNPGDVLVLPHRWWHYVENLDLAISINAWLQLPQDDEQRLSESIVQLLVSQFCKSIEDDEVKNLILNPNSTDIADYNLESLVNLVNTCQEVSKKRINTTNKKRKKLNTTQILDAANVTSSLPSFETIPVLSIEEFKKFLEQQNSRFNNRCGGVIPNQNNVNFNKYRDVIQSITDVDVISLISQKLLKL